MSIWTNRAAKREAAEKRRQIERRVEAAQTAYDAALLRYSAAATTYADAVMRQSQLEAEAGRLAADIRAALAQPTAAPSPDREPGPTPSEES